MPKWRVEMRLILDKRLKVYVRRVMIRKIMEFSKTRKEYIL